MVCIYCGSGTYVTNTRLQKRSNNVWRRRTCVKCGAVFSTGEQADYEKSWVVQYGGSKSNSLAPFLRDKLFISIHKSVQHRPTALQDAIGLTDTVINHVAHEIRDGGLRSEIIALETFKTLQRFDKPAAISYQAFHTDVL